MNFYARIIILFLCFLITLGTQTATSKVYQIQNIQIDGLKRTHKKVVLNELLFKKGQSARIKDIENSIINLKNTGLFSDVTYQVRDKKLLVLKVEERWTTIPILKASSGGGVSQFTFGAYDPNLFGRYITAGAQYERLGDANSGVIWYENPQLFTSKYGMQLQFWKTDRLRTKYDKTKNSAIPITGFLHQRNKIYFSLSNEITPKFNTQVFYEYNDDTFSDKSVPDKVKPLLLTTGLPLSSEFHFMGLNLEYGQLKTGAQSINGSLLKGSYSYGFSSTSSNKDFWKSDFNFRYYKTIQDLVYAQRIMLGMTNTNVLQYWNYLGGLDRVRGFADNRFAGRFYWLSNSELRYSFFRNKSLTLQATGFVDIATTAEYFKNLDQITALSAGGGLRIILPKIYRFVVRLDYGVPLIKQDDMNFSFSVQQFF